MENAMGFFSNEVHFACSRKYLVIYILAPVQGIFMKLSSPRFAPCVLQTP